VWEGVGVATPDAGRDGLDPEVMMDLVLGTPETLEDWKKYLFTWPNPAHRFRRYADGRIEDLGPLQEDVHPRLDDLLSLRFRTLLREKFGSVEQADEMFATFRSFIADLDRESLDDLNGTAPGGGEEATDGPPQA